MTPLLMGVLLLCTVPSAHAQDYTTHLSKEFTLPHQAEVSVLSVYNISGSVKVEGYDGNKVLMEIEETISSDDADELEKGKREVQLGFVQQGDTLMAYMTGPHDSRPDYRCCQNDRKNIHYRYQIDYTIKVPFAMNLDVSTVNNGAIVVHSVGGSLNISNVNNRIELTGVKGTTHAGTVNGGITVSYVTNPPGASYFNTVNGVIRVSCPKDFSADVQFKSMHGDLYTDFDNTELQDNVVVQKKDADGNNTYKLDKLTGVRFGKGGKLCRFQTLNGNVYIQKQS